MDARWNTGRPYTNQGQIIRAATQADGSIPFADLSRRIDGRIAAPPLPLADVDTFKRYVLRAHDESRYTIDAES